MSVSTGALPAAVVSANGTVGTSGTDVVVTGGQFQAWVTIQNTHSSNTLKISANNPCTTNDFVIQPGAALTFPYGPANNLYGLGSAAGTTFAVFGA